MKEEVGRWFTWFLQPRTESSYRKHHQDVVASASHLAWRCLIGVVVDKRLYPEANQFPHLFEGFNISFPPSPRQPWWDHYAEVTGKGQWLKREAGEDYLTLIPDDAPTVTLKIPLKAIVSDRATGFPKVAYNVEQFLVGYQSILDCFRSTMHNASQRLTFIRTLLHPKNFAEDVYASILTIIKSESITASDIDALEALMIMDMRIRIPQQCKGMYHHAFATHIHPQVLKATTPIGQAFEPLLKTYPNILPGRAFIMVNSIKLD